MDKKDVIAFFDRCASGWDADLVKNDAVIAKILDNAEVKPGQDILDVACGTGVMIPYYLSRKVASVTGIDISPEMAKIAREKFSHASAVEILCGDVEEAWFDKKFDVIVVYNAFPHFPDPRRLIATLADLLKEGGRLTIAHGASREAIDGHHKGAASKVSNGLMSADSLRALFTPYFDVEVTISNGFMYQVSGVKQDGKGHSHADGDHGCDTGDMAELLALMKFMVSHNDAHARELAGLAGQLKEAGRSDSYRKLMDAVSGFDLANSQLDAVRKDLEEENI